MIKRYFRSWWHCAATVFLLVLVVTVAASAERTIYVPPPKGGEDISGEDAGKDRDDAVTLINEDRLSGRVLRTDESGAMVIRHPLLGTDITVPVSAVKSIAFHGTGDRPGGKENDSVLITNGDTFTGIVTGLTAERLTLETDYAGILNLNRKMVATVSMGTGGRVLLNEDFSAGMGGWEPHGGVWAVADETLTQTQYGSYFISRDIEQSGPMTFEWTISTIGSGHINAGVAIFCSGKRSMQGGDSYYLSVNGGTVYLYRVKGNSTTSVSHKYLQTSTKSATCKVEYDPEDGKIVFIVNGREMASYTDPSPLKKGSYFLLCASQPTVFDNVRIVRGTSGQAAVIDAEGERDVVLFTNGDRTSGKVLSISRKKLVMKTSFGVIKLDLPNVASIRFSGSEMEQPRRRAGDALVVLASHDRMTVEIGSLDADTLKGYMDCAGEITLLRPALRGIRFHIYDR